jgi:glycerophosphoryl diester phosphodiesterase
MLLAACAPIVTSARQDDVAHRLAPADLAAFFDCLRETGQTVVAAHRGGPTRGYAENAIETFANTLSLAPALLEVDVSRTRDGALVLMHDDTLDRTTTGHGQVSDVALAEFRTLRLEDETGAVLNAHPPTLRQALDWADGRAILQLDIKRDVTFEDVISVVRAAGAVRRVVLITYTTGAAIRAHRLAPEAMLSANVSSESDLSTLQRAGIDLTRVLAWTGIEQPNRALNLALAQRGVEAMFGTLGGQDSWDQRFARAGDDQYAEIAQLGLQVISTDRPAAAAQDLDAADGLDGLGAMQCEDARR